MGQFHGLLVLLACGALLACGGLLVVVLVARGVDRANVWAGVVGADLAIAGALVALVRWWLTQRAAGGVSSDQMAQDEQLNRAVTDLAIAVHSQWKHEARLRSLQRFKPIRIRWSITDRQFVAANEDAQEAVDAAVLHKGVMPEVGHVVQLFRKLPTRQIMVLGDAGAGKTVLALLFTLGLLDSRRAHEPVPVLLSASSWDPGKEHLHTWMTRRLLEDYPGLANHDVYGPDVAKRIVTKRRVMVVLDGLDEIPAKLLPEAIEALDGAVVGAHPVLVTCQGDVYEKAVRKSGMRLTRAAVLEIQSMDLDDAATFLMAAGPSAKDRWGPVMEEFRSQPNAPLAHVLASPLMASLAGPHMPSPSLIRRNC